MFYLMSRRPRRSTLFPYTTLFRSCGARRREEGRIRDGEGAQGRRQGEGRDGQSQGGDREGEEGNRSEEHTSELQSLAYLVCRLLLEKKKTLDGKKLAMLICTHLIV